MSRAIAAAIADVLAGRGLVVYAGPGGSARVLNAREVSQLLGRSTQWVYAHATELGAIRMGNGPKARIGFDLATSSAIPRAADGCASRCPSPPGRSSRWTSSSR
jgi:hypothetical protein